MWDFFKYVNIYKTVRDISQNPEDFVADFSLTYIKNFFLIMGSLFFLCAGLFLIIGHVGDILLLKVLGYIFLGVFVIDIFGYFFIKKIIQRISSTLGQNTRNFIKQQRMTSSQVIDVEINHEKRSRK